MTGPIRVDVYHHFDPPTPTIPDPRLDQILAALVTLQQEFTTMSGTLDTEITQLQTDVAAETTVVNSAVTLIAGFSAQLTAAIAAATAAGASPAELTELTALDTSITASSTALAAAVAANTTPPVVPVTPATPVTTPPVVPPATTP